MKKHFDNWMELANSEDRGWELDIKDHELMFVTEVVTTTQWMVVAIHGPESTKMKISGFGDASMLANGRFTVSMSNQTWQAMPHHRYGPQLTRNPRMITDGRPAIASNMFGHDTDTAQRGDQVLFVHFYKMKRKLWLLREPMRAGAGPHQLPPGPEPDDPSAEGLTTPESREFEKASVPADVKVSMLDARGDVY